MQPITFQALSWYAQDVEDETNGEYNYTIKVFGMDEFGKTVGLTVRNFEPFFYIKIKKTWATDLILMKINNQLETLIGHVGISVVNRKDFWGFTNDEIFSYIKLKFQSLQKLKQAVSKLGKPINIPGITTTPYKFQLYESNIEPFIKFMHIRKLIPTGWIVIDKYRDNTDILPSLSEIDIECFWKSVCGTASTKTAPFLIASFDLECTSSGGEFPVPKKTFKHLATQLYETFLKCTTNGLSDYTKRTTIIECIEFALGFRDSCNYIVSRVHTKKLLDPTVLTEILNLRIDDIFGIFNGPGGKEKIVGALVKYFNAAKWLSSLKGDEIIQIGTTFHAYGNKTCHLRHIITLGSCDPIDGAIVETCETEEEMMLKWTALIIRTNPDILTGFNIFGFDFDYLFHRADELGILREFMRLSRLQNHTCKFKEQKLSSSALGDNMLKYINMEGRVIVDLMKVVQRDHKLDSYKLDNVAKHFTGQKKNDVSPKDIFQLQKGNSADRKIIAEYCIQDCELCNHLVMKLEIIANNMGMSNVCLVPMEYIFMRGQGIKIFSLVLNECNNQKTLIPVVKKDISIRKEDVEKIAEVCGTPFAKIEEEIKDIVKHSKSDTRLDNFTYSNVATAILMRATQANFETVSAKCFNYSKYNEVTKVAAILEENMNDDDETYEGDDGYEGAIVLKPKQGIYIDEPVSVLDYASLYPSSMISENLSHDKIVIDSKYDNLPGIEYVDIPYDIFNGVGDKKTKVGERICRFVQGEKGIIPKILQKLLTARKATRKKMTEMTYNGVCGFLNDAKSSLFSEDGDELVKVLTIEDCKPSHDEFQLAVLDGLQNAYKVTANSLYGQIGAKTSSIYLKDIAACTTATGRNMIMKAKDFLETNYGANVVYGDSVANYTPVLVRVHNTVEYCQIDELATKFGNDIWIPASGDKEACDLCCVETWTERGWTKLHRIIRHTLAIHKKMVRVQTNNGIVDVTDDHSLLLENGDEISPKDTSIGTILMHHELPTFSENSVTTSPRDANYMGESAKKNQIVPMSVLNGPFDVRKSYWNGLRETFGLYVRTNSQLCAASIVALCNSIGCDVELSSHKDDYHLDFTKFSRSLNAVNKIEEIDYMGEFVYDLTTDNHHFAAGIGKMIVHNTDSIFVIFPNSKNEAEIPISHDSHQKLSGRSKIMASIKTCKEASSIFKKNIKRPHDLEYEKTFWPFVLLSKKRYVGNVYEHDDVHFKQKSMGIVLKRRDNANIVKLIYGGIINIILNDKDVAKSVEFMKKSLDDLIAGNYPIETLIISKSLSAEYKDPTRIAHKVLAERIASRDPGNKPQISDRIPYIFVQTTVTDPKLKILQGDRIETIEFALQEKLVPDYAFYITNQIMKPILQIYALIVEQLPGFANAYPLNYLNQIERHMAADINDECKVAEKMETVREVVVKELLFNPILEKITNTKIRKSMIVTKYFEPKVAKPKKVKVVDPDAPPPKPRAPRKAKVVDPDAPPPKPRAPRKVKVVDPDAPPPKPRAPRKVKVVDPDAKPKKTNVLDISQ
jgi:DNA polymerase elongation subunit (family B)